MTDIHKFNVFSYNFPYNFIEEIWGGTHLEKHLSDKFHDIYERNGSKAVMIEFYMQLDGGNRELLENYVTTKTW